MKTRIKKIGKIILWIIGVIVGLIALAMLTGFTLHNTYYKNQMEEIKPYGKMVQVDSKNMHVYSMGDGEETIVLLPGHGVPLPSADFAPLMRKLSEKYRVVTVEYFGVGFSDETDKSRTCENYMNEIRESLDKAGIKPPYILMPHSISGVYSEYYATKYPEEVKGMILLDTTPTAYTMEIPKEIIRAYNMSKFIQNISLQRLLSSFDNEDVLIEEGLSLTTENGNTQKEIDDYEKYKSYTVNDTIIEQLGNLNLCIEEVKNLPFPEDIPVLKIMAKETIKSKQSSEDIQRKGSEEAHLKRLGANTSHVILDSSHNLIYRNQIEEIKRLTDEFIENLK